MQLEICYFIVNGFGYGTLKEYINWYGLKIFEDLLHNLNSRDIKKSCSLSSAGVKLRLRVPSPDKNVQMHVKQY